MVKIWVEVCLISARGLRRTSSLFKLQWYAVAWIEPNNKYCSRIAASGNANPVWKTKFSALVDNSEPKFQDLALHIELKKWGAFNCGKGNPASLKDLSTFRSEYQRKEKNPVLILVAVSRTLNFILVSDASISASNDEGFKLTDRNIGINLANEYGTSQANPPQFPPPPLGRPENHLPTTSAYTHPVPLPTAYSNSSQGAPSYPPGGGPKQISHNQLTTLICHPLDVAVELVLEWDGTRAGALAAGAVIFGDDFMSGFDVPTGLQGASLTVTTDPPF
ncbi:calcium-dependent lipid-binding (CaLB domain) family protein [Actinidia rufa]|uniref:Calcium-dependent lipid-binding (CaLB domain) family protein n=1 Tax=Actinidia rufa TaxID=165716 RepID=A0A7J0E6N3_9ERIC|nr:calcium-dependent lipid-binding (CaLB domain) family protein [Actinidia rufa]